MKLKRNQSTTETELLREIILRLARLEEELEMMSDDVAEMKSTAYSEALESYFGRGFGC